MRCYGGVTRGKPAESAKPIERLAGLSGKAKKQKNRRNNVDMDDIDHTSDSGDIDHKDGDFVPANLVDKLYHDFNEQLTRQKESYEKRIEELELENKFASDTLGKEMSKMMAEYNEIKNNTLDIIGKEIAVSGTLETTIGKALIKKNEQLKKLKKKPLKVSNRIEELSKPKKISHT